MSNFLDNITFNKHVTLKEPKEDKQIELKDPAKSCRRTLIKFVFFITVLILLFIAINYGSLYTISFIKGHEYQSWGEIKDDFTKE